jgi:hypothetical protein
LSGLKSIFLSITSCEKPHFWFRLINTGSRPCSTCTRFQVDCKETSAKVAAQVAASQSAPRRQSNTQQPDQTHDSSQAACDERSRADSPAIYSQRPSTYEAVDQVFRQRQETSNLNHETDAIPGGTQGAIPQQNFITWHHITNVELPPAHVVDVLLDAYMTSVHWFMSVFHEPTIRTNASSVLATGVVKESHKLFPILLLVIISMGARYISPETAQRACPEYDLTAFEPVWIRAVENRLLDVFEEGGLEAVQIAIILKSYWLYGNKPKRSIAIVGGGIKVALSMKLHLESTWSTKYPIEVNVRRRLWWSLYVAYVSLWT